jgi:hypothetical protein
VKSGLKVYHAKAGKKTIGTASPGKSSGLSTDKGREIDIGMIMAANESMEIRRWNKITRLFLVILVKK